MNVASIYRFITPLLDVSQETEKIKQIFDCIKRFLKSQWLKVNISKTRNNGLFVKIDAEILSINFSIFDLKWDEKLYLPLFKMDIFVDDKFFYKNRKKFVEFLTSLFECFDWINEKEYLIEMNQEVYYKNWLLGEKHYPYYDFQDIEKLYKDFKTQDGVGLLENFLKKYHNWFKLNLQTADEYHKVNGFLIFLMYLIYLMHMVLYGVKDNLQVLDDLQSKNIEYKANLDLQRKRLNILWNNLNEVYPRYLKFLKEFLRLFER